MSKRARFRERLESAGAVHVDARVLGYHLLGREPYVELTRQLFRALSAGDVAARTSALSLYQILAEPYRRDREETARAAETYLTAFRGLELVPVSADVAGRAAQVRARLGGRSERAVQIATALVSDADLFLTQGSGLRRIVGMAVADLDDFLPESR